MSEQPAQAIKVGDVVIVNSYQVAIPNEQATVTEQDGVLGVVCSMMYGSDQFMPLSILEEVTKREGDEPVSEETITLHYEMWEGDVTPHFLLPLPKVGIMDIVRVSLVDSIWEVRSTEPDTSPHWIGRGEYKQVALLEYLKARLGHFEKEPASE